MQACREKKLEVTAVRVYGSASGAHVYSSTCLLPASAAAINSLSTPEFTAGSREPFAASHGRAPRAGSCQPCFSRAERAELSSGFGGLHVPRPIPSLRFAASCC